MEEKNDTTDLVEADPPEWPVWARPVLDVIAQVPSISEAARRVEVDRRTVQRLAERDPRYAAAIRDARNVALDVLERVIYARASVGQPVKRTVTKTIVDQDGTVRTETTVTEENHISDSLAMFYMKRWRPEYRDQVKVQHGGDPDAPAIQHEHDVFRVPSQERMRQLVEIARDLELSRQPDIDAFVLAAEVERQG